MCRVLRRGEAGGLGGLCSRPGPWGGGLSMLTAVSSPPLPPSWHIWNPGLPKSGAVGTARPARPSCVPHSPAPQSPPDPLPPLPLCSSVVHIWPGPLPREVHSVSNQLPPLPWGLPGQGHSPSPECLAGSRGPERGSHWPCHWPRAPRSVAPASGAARSPDPDLPSWECENQIWEVAEWEPR